MTWLLNKNEIYHNLDDIYDGTGMYGDNGEFPTYEDALEFGLQEALKHITL